MRARSSAGRAAGRLREQILRGDMLPGTPLREVALAAELTISRNTLREALQLLACEGLVTQVANKGAAIRQLTPVEVHDIYQVRRVLEGQAYRSGPTSGPQALARLEMAVIASEQAERHEAWRAASTASLHFHQALVGLLGSRRLDEFFSSVLAQLRLAWAEAPDEQAFQRSWAARDRRLYELLRTGRRTEGLGALAAYLDDSEQQVLDALRHPRRA